MNKNKYFELLNDYTGEVLYEGWFTSIKACVERAVSDNVCLDGVDLEGQNLACANLDEAQMTGANLTRANLNGANLSEGVFDNARMIGADLSHCCFALSSLVNVDMIGASFAVTDVTDAVITGCQFSCPSVFSILFSRCAVFSHCGYVHPDKGYFKMTRPPITITGLPREVVYLDHVVKIGHDFVLKGDVVAAGARHMEFLYGAEIAAFLSPALYDHRINV